MLIVNEHVITPTIFPDGTSQVWHIPELDPTETVQVQFIFEPGTTSEAEVFHLLQIGMLLQAQKRPAILTMPFLPYGRQDHPIYNDCTFALHAFGELLRLCDFQEVRTIDAHSNVLSSYVPLTNDDAHLEVWSAASDCDASVFCFPDSSAAKRYETRARSIVLDKDRDPATGNITGMVLQSGQINPNDSVLIVDDICDGGRTFIEACKLIKRLEPTASVHLYVSHGIFSKGLDVLREAGIEQIFTKDGKVL